MKKLIAGNALGGGPGGFIIHIGKAKVLAPVGLVVDSSSVLRYDINAEIVPHKFVFMETEGNVSRYDEYESLPTYPTVIHINKDAIINSQMSLDAKGVITVYKDDQVIQCSIIEIAGRCVLKHNDACPRIANQTHWIETDSEVIIRS